MQTCSKCSRANPPEAIYCFFDGFVLAGHDRRGGPVAVGAQPFNSPFVFPNGRTCRSFDELALACLEEWTTACGLLADGYLESFLGGLGRVDLALAAKEAAHFPDPERGLDQLLGQLPTGVLADPKLRVDPVEVNLGLLDGDRERTFDLELENQGSRLLYGTVSSSALWLTLGDVVRAGEEDSRPPHAPAGANGEGHPPHNPALASEKHFHFTSECRITVHVRPERFPAGDRPSDARLLVESNGGTSVVVVRAEKPIQPFAPGPLGGAKKPRQVAEKAQANPKEVAPLFESGEVERWYRANGWTYPVKIPAASGIAAIQQFFEALGVTKAPKVEISARQFAFQADPGAALEMSVDISTQEKRPVFAHATSTVPWLEVSRAKFNGRVVTIHASIPSVPNRPGELLEAELDVISNGNQRFHLPVTVQVSGERLPEPPLSVDDDEGAFDFASAAPPEPPEQVEPSPDLELAPPPRPKLPAGRKPAARDEKPLWMHAAPAGLLCLALLGVVLYDRIWPRKELAGSKGLPPIAGVRYDPRNLKDALPRVGYQFNDTERFGVLLVDPADPAERTRWTRLTAKEDGSTNNVVVKIGNSEYIFGFETPNNRMIYRQRRLPEPYLGCTSTMDFKEEKVRVTQYVQIIPGPEGFLDTVLIYFTAANLSTGPRKVAIRYMLDTYIGKNDGVPFTAPGTKDFVTTKADYEGGEVPDYLEAVEKPKDPKDPGTIARLGLRGIGWSGVELLEPERVRICRYPDNPNIKWDWEPQPMGDDSCVAVYWPEKELAPKQVMHVALTYGLGRLEISDQLALSAPGTVPPNREFVITAYVYQASKGQKVTLQLPPDLVLSDGEASRPVTAPAERTQVFWKVKARREGAFQIEARSGGARARPITIQVTTKSIFG